MKLVLRLVVTLTRSSSSNAHFAEYMSYVLCEVIALAKAGKIKHKIQKFPLSEIYETIQLLKSGCIY
jgi:DNA-binding TFAR19-related protein (PDSD5 family)